MNYKDSLLKQENIKWKQPRIKWQDDDSMDLVLKVPIQKLLEGQAYKSFNAGVIALFDFLEIQKDKPLPELKTALIAQLAEWKKT